MKFASESHLEYGLYAQRDADDDCHDDAGAGQDQRSLQALADHQADLLRSAVGGAQIPLEQFPKPDKIPDDDRLIQPQGNLQCFQVALGQLAGRRHNDKRSARCDVDQEKYDKGNSQENRYRDQQSLDCVLNHAFHLFIFTE